jgi:probable HAF family extracellular repeat protein
MRTTIAVGLGVLGFLQPLSGRSYAVGTLALDLSNRGHVVGSVPDGGNNWAEGGQAFLWERGELTLLPWSGSGSLAVAVNDRGQVAGYGLDRSGARPLQAVLWTNGRAVDLLPEATWAEALAINNRGQVAVVDYDAWPAQAYLWEEGTLVDMGLTTAQGPGPSNDSFHGLALNERGDVIGDDHEWPSPQKSFFWSRGRRTALSFRATALNSRGQAVGESFLWEEGVLTDLGSLGGGNTMARAINDLGQVAGYSYTDTGDRHVFLWERGRMEDLGDVPNSFALDVIGLDEQGDVLAVSGVVVWRLRRNSEPVQIGVLRRDGTVYLQWVGGYMNDRGQTVVNMLDWGLPGYGSYLHVHVWAHGELIPLEDFAPRGPTAPMATVPRTTPEPDLAVRIASSPGARPVALEVSGASAAAPYVASIFDVRGRLVQRWERPAGAELMATWDGRGSDGSFAPAGVYFVKVASQGRHSTAKIVLTR